MTEKPGPATLALLGKGAHDNGFDGGSYPEKNRWDYLLGHTPSGEVIALEPHTARQDQVGTVMRGASSASTSCSVPVVSRLGIGRTWRGIERGSFDTGEVTPMAARDTCLRK